MFGVWGSEFGVRSLKFVNIKTVNMNNKEFAEIMEYRTKQLAINIFALSSHLPNSTEGNVVRNQICKSGSSIGANYREANRARSRADFKNKISICESEASETIYWLEIIIESNMINYELIKEVYNEANEVLAIFTSIGKNTKT